MPYHRPDTLDDALMFLADPGAVVLAGGTDLYPGLRDGPPPSTMVDLSGVASLRGITQTPEGWTIGATTTWTDLVQADLPPLFDGLKQAARAVGSVQIQNTGTVAGNLCNASPAADGVPALMTLDAIVEMAGPGGRRRLPLSDFLLGPRHTALPPGDIVTAIHIPQASGCGAFAKLGARKYLVISIAMVAAVLETEAGRVTSARVSVGACSPVALRLSSLETALTGAQIGEVGAIVGAGDLARLTPIDDVRASAGYRADAVRTLITRTILQAMETAHVA